MASKKKLRRYLRRIADRKDISYRDSICNFYGKKLDKINKSLLYSLHKNTVSRGNLPKALLNRGGALRYDEKHVGNSGTSGEARKE